MRHATDVSNVHVTLDRDVLLLAVKTHVKTTAFILRSVTCRFLIVVLKNTVELK